MAYSVGGHQQKGVSPLTGGISGKQTPSRTKLLFHKPRQQQWFKPPKEEDLDPAYLQSFLKSTELTSPMYQPMWPPAQDRGPTGHPETGL